MTSLAHPDDDPQSLSAWLDLAEKNLDDAHHALGVADLILSAALTEGLECDLGTWKLSECSTGQYVRRVERLQRRRHEIVTGYRNGMTYISVNVLADAIDQTPGATRKLLARELIPGARRKTPGLNNSPWLIPASAPGEYLASHSNGKEN